MRRSESVILGKGVVNGSSVEYSTDAVEHANEVLRKHSHAYERVGDALV